MRQILLGIFVALTFTSCGGGGAGVTPASPRAEQQCSREFINGTALTDAQLMEQWMEAQKDVAGESPDSPRGVMLNELQVALTGATPTYLLDSKALNVWPKCIHCVTLADAANGPGFSCPESPTGRCYGVIRQGVVYGAKSVENQVYTYEFTTLILLQLGYQPQR